MAWAKSDSTTLSVDTTEINSATFTATTFNQTMAFVLGSDGAPATNNQTRFNDDTGTKYSTRYSVDGGTDATSVSGTAAQIHLWHDALPWFVIGYWINISADEKLVICHSVEQSTAGAANAPRRQETIYKFTETGSQITSQEIDMDGTKKYLSDSNLSILGTD